jgi:superfamily I DNA and RNA helicase
MKNEEVRMKKGGTQAALTFFYKKLSQTIRS